MGTHSTKSGKKSEKEETLKVSEKNIIVVGDRVLLRLVKDDTLTKSGIIVPEGVKEKESTACGYVVKVGPGYMMPDFGEVKDDWKPNGNDPKFISMQAKVGDFAIFLRNSGVRIQVEDEEYVVAPHGAILVLIRDDLIEGM